MSGSGELPPPPYLTHGPDIPPPHHGGNGLIYEDNGTSRQGSRRSKGLLQNMNPLKSRIEDVYFAVMGLTGAGKSTFIELCIGRRAGIGHGLMSCTVNVEDYTFMYNDSLRVHLIDTPGFDDSTRKDTEVLRDIAGWMGVTYDKGIRLSGIIYLHNISHTRMAGSAMRNLFMFQKLMGQDCFPSIVLATSFWSNVDPMIGADREKELISTDMFWGEMYKNGSKIVRHTGDRQSALQILNILIRRKHPIVTQIQREMNVERRELDETSAGEQLNADIIKLQKKHQEEMAQLHRDMEEAIATQNKEAASQIAKLQDDVKQQMIKAEEERKGLQVDLERINKERMEEMKKYQAEIQKAIDDLQKKNEEYEELQKNKYISRDEMEAKNKEIEDLRNMIKTNVSAAQRKQTGFWSEFGDWLEDLGREISKTWKEIFS